MQAPQPTHDWADLADQIGAKPRLRDPWPGIRILWWCFVSCALAVFMRLAWIEWSDGAAYRTLAARPLERRITLPARRGRIVARDGQALAEDESIACAGVQYRWLEEPVNETWLRRTARSRLTAAERKDVERVRQAQESILAERATIQIELSHLSGMSEAQWERRRADVQRRVTAIRDAVNQARLKRWQAAQAKQQAPDSMFDRVVATLARVLTPDDAQRAPEPITIAEELDFHVMGENLTPDAMRRVEAMGRQLPAVRVMTQQRRRYPRGTTAAHLVGYLGPADARTPHAEAGQRVGRSGLERAFEESLRGAAGTRVEHLRRNGQLISAFDAIEVRNGQELRTTLDVQLQQGAESLLTDALARQAASADGAATSGGAVIVLECASGAVLAAASLPGFDPNWFEQQDSSRVAALLNDAAHPLLDRAIQMQIPPGSVFKIVTAFALLERRRNELNEPYDCRGYLQNPEQQRCAIFTRYGSGHGPVMLHDALVQSCNCYFFHHVGGLGSVALLRRATDFGLGAATGIELPAEASGQLPDVTRGASGDAQSLSIGQGAITVTPMQIARMMACVANGGHLVRPHLVLPARASGPGPEQGSSVPLLEPDDLQIVRAALTDAVASPSGTAHSTGRMATLAVAGKTGTAESSGGLADHAWFAGYAPAEAPEVAFVVALEHGGEASQTAVPLARRLLEQMERLGYFAGSKSAPITWNRRESQEVAPASFQVEIDQR